jgi:ubiquinone/menaquinone biosynthesis C-methylase UbiE
VLDELDLDGKSVCDVGAGTGRFTLPAAKRAQRVIAVDAVPAMLERLQDKADAAALDNIEIRRGAFTALPVAERSVDIAVACSSFTSAGPLGGLSAVREAERIVCAGGSVAIIWPQDPLWLRGLGFEHVRLRGEQVHAFRDVATAERLCATYYSDAAAAWVRVHHARDIPYSVLGSSPPNDVCIKRCI